MKYIIALALLLISSAADAACSPWVSHAESALPKDGATYTTNPTAFFNGLVGEAQLPYTVPLGKQLTINYLSIEGIWGAALWPWIGLPPFDGNKVLQTFTAPDLNIPLGQGPLTDGNHFSLLSGTREWHPNFVLPAGLILNLTMAAWHQSSEGWVYGWVMSGQLCDYP